MTSKHYEQIAWKVRNAVIVPRNLPLEYSRNDYRVEITREVMRLIHKGCSVENAFQRTTGYSLSKGMKANRKRGGRHRKEVSKAPRRAVLSAVAACLLGGVGFGTITAVDHYTPETVSALAASKDAMESIDPYNKDTTILFVGVDKRPAEDKGYGNSEDVSGKRTDIIALAKLSAVDNSINVVSIPRDTGVDSTPCIDEGSGFNALYATNEKINILSSTYGDSCLTKVVEEMSGETVDAYVEVDFEGFKSFIDSIGGVEVSTDTSVVDDTLGVIIDKPGVHKLDGVKALDYARARKVEGTGKSDLDRIKRQQEILTAVVESAGEDGIFNKMDTVRSIITSVAPHMSIDGLSTDDLISLAKKASELNKDDIHAATIPIVADDNYGNLVYDAPGTRELFREMFGHDGYPRGSSSLIHEDENAVQSTDVPSQSSPVGNSW